MTEPQIELGRTFTADALQSTVAGSSGASLMGVEPIAGYSSSFLMGLLVELAGGVEEALAGVGVVDHGGLTGLADDDHPQYVNNARGDVRYRQLSVAIPFADLPVAADNESHASKILRSTDSRLVGARMPSGGLANHVLKKVDGTDYNVTWAAETGGGGGTGIVVQNEGSALVVRPNLNFIGGVVNAADDSGNNRTNVTIGGYGTVQDEGVAVTTRDILDFRGVPVTVTDDTTRTRVTISPTYPTIAEETTALTARPLINLVGGLITAADDAANNRTNVTVAAPGMSDLPQGAKTKDIVLYNGADPLVAGATSVTGSYPITRAGTIIRVDARVATAPTGSGVGVAVKRYNSGGTLQWTHSMTIAASAKVASSTGLSLAVADGDYLTMECTGIGSTIAGGKLTCLAEEVIT